MEKSGLRWEVAVGRNCGWLDMTGQMKGGAKGKRWGVVDVLGEWYAKAPLLRTRLHLEVTLGASSNAKLRELAALQKSPACEW